MSRVGDLSGFGMAYRKIVGTLSRTVDLVATHVLCIRWSPCSGVVSSSRMFDLDDLCSVGDVSVPWFYSQTSSEVVQVSVVPEVT